MWSLKTRRLWVLSGAIVLGVAVGGGAEVATGHSLIVVGLFGGVGLGMILIARLGADHQ